MVILDSPFQRRKRQSIKLLYRMGSRHLLQTQPPQAISVLGRLQQPPIIISQEPQTKYACAPRARLFFQHAPRGGRNNYLFPEHYRISLHTEYERWHLQS